MYDNNMPIELEEQHIYCEKLNSISSFNDKILFKKHTHTINHIDLKKNLLMTSGDDDLIIIVDLKNYKYILTFYDIINGTKYSTFLEPLSTKIIYYGYKSFKLYIYDYQKDSILFVVNLLREKLTHFEYNNKSNIIITTQNNNNIVWQLQDKKINPEYNIKNSYYAVINDNKQHIISCAKTYNNNNISKINTILSIYKYDFNRSIIIVKERDLNLEIGYDVKLMDIFKNIERYYLILMSDYTIEIIDLENNDIIINNINLIKDKNLKFTCFEPVFTKEIIIGYNNGDVEVVNPLKNEKYIKEEIENKYKVDIKIRKIINDIKNDVIKHETSVVQIKMSDYYPLYVSIADEMIIYQLKNLYI